MELPELEDDCTVPSDLDVLDRRPFKFYRTTAPFQSFVDCQWWHSQGIRIGEC